MKRLDIIINKLKRFESEIFKTIEGVIRENEGLIVEMNSEDQLFEHGINRKGESLASYAPYSPVTIEIKRQKGQPTGRVTLRDEEDFHLSFYIDYQADGFEIRASDWKERDLTDYYGEEILGLTDENLRELTHEYIAPEILKMFKEFTL